MGGGGACWQLEHPPPSSPISMEIGLNSLSLREHSCFFLFGSSLLLIMMNAKEATAMKIKQRMEKIEKMWEMKRKLYDGQKTMLEEEN